jgi:hypothetical protein
MSKKHRVRLHRWAHGQLEVLDSYFDTASEARHFSNSIGRLKKIAVRGIEAEEFQISIKVYDELNQLTHTTTVSSNSYA